MLNDLVDSYADYGLVILMGDVNGHVNSKHVIKPLDGRDCVLVNSWKATN